MSTLAMSTTLVGTATLSSSISPSPNQQLQIKMDEVKKDIIKEMSTELDKHNVGGDAYQSSQILDEVTRVHDRMTALLSGNKQQRGGGRGYFDDINILHDVFA